MSSRTSVLAASVAGVLGGAVIGGGVWMGASANPERPAAGSATVRSTEVTECRPRAGHLGEALPEELRRDLGQTRDLEPEKRRTALEEYLGRALAGDYGEEAEQLAEKRAEHREKWSENRDAHRHGSGEKRSQWHEKWAEKVPEALREDLSESGSWLRRSEVPRWGRSGRRRWPASTASRRATSPRSVPGKVPSTARGAAPRTGGSAAPERTPA